MSQEKKTESVNQNIQNYNFYTTIFKQPRRLVSDIFIFCFIKISFTKKIPTANKLKLNLKLNK